MDGPRLPTTTLTDLLWMSLGQRGSRAVYQALIEAAVLHAGKSDGYRSTTDPLDNFYSARAVKAGRLTPVQYAWELVDKQDQAADRILHAEPAEYHRRGGLVMLRERLMDGLVYRAIMLALIDSPDAEVLRSGSAVDEAEADIDDYQRRYR